MDTPLTSAVPPAYLTRLAPRLVGSSACFLMDARWFGTVARSKVPWTEDDLFWRAGLRHNGAGREILRRPAKRQDEFGFPSLEVHIRFDEKVLGQYGQSARAPDATDAGRRAQSPIREIVPTLVPVSPSTMAARPHACSPRFGVPTASTDFMIFQRPRRRCQLLHDRAEKNLHASRAA